MSDFKPTRRQIEWIHEDRVGPVIVLALAKVIIDLQEADVLDEGVPEEKMLDALVPFATLFWLLGFTAHRGIDCKKSFKELMQQSSREEH